MRITHSRAARRRAARSWVRFFGGSCTASFNVSAASSRTRPSIADVEEPPGYECGPHIRRVYRQGDLQIQGLAEISAGYSEQAPVPVLDTSPFVAGSQEFSCPPNNFAGHIWVRDRSRPDGNAKDAHSIAAERHGHSVDDGTSASQSVEAPLKRSNLCLGKNVSGGSKSKKCSGLKVLIRSLPLGGFIDDRGKVGTTVRDRATARPQKPCSGLSGKSRLSVSAGLRGLQRAMP